MALDDYILDAQATNPSGGAEVSFTIPAGVWRVLSISLNLSTSATVANRTVQIILRNTGNAFAFFLQAAGLTEAASLVYRYVFARGVAASAAPIVAAGNNYAMVPLPSELIVVGGDTLATSTLNLDVTDAYASIFVRLERLWRP